jgi:hypothetical protein
MPCQPILPEWHKANGSEPISEIAMRRRKRFLDDLTSGDKIWVSSANHVSPGPNATYRWEGQ